MATVIKYIIDRPLNFIYFYLLLVMVIDYTYIQKLSRYLLIIRKYTDFKAIPIQFNNKTINKLPF